MKNKYIHILTGGLLALAVSSGAFAGGMKFMTAEQISTALTGKTCEGVHHRKDFEFKVYFNPDKSFLRKKEYDTQKGKWRINGNEHCLYFYSNDNEFCRKMVDNGDGSYSKYKVLPHKTVKITTMKNCKPGNSVK